MISYTIWGFWMIVKHANNYLCLELYWRKGDDHTRLDNTSLHPPHRHCSNTSYLVNILQREAQWLPSRSCRRHDRVQSLKKSCPVSLPFLTLYSPPLSVIVKTRTCYYP